MEPMPRNYYALSGSQRALIALAFAAVLAILLVGMKFNAQYMKSLKQVRAERAAAGHATDSKLFDLADESRLEAWLNAQADTMRATLAPLFVPLRPVLDYLNGFLPPFSEKLHVPGVDEAQMRERVRRVSEVCPSATVVRTADDERPVGRRLRNVMPYQIQADISCDRKLFTDENSKWVAFDVAKDSQWVYNRAKFECPQARLYIAGGAGRGKRVQNRTIEDDTPYDAVITCPQSCYHAILQQTSNLRQREAALRGEERTWRDALKE